MKTVLITLGCSWTFGVGAGYEPGMSKEQYQQIAWDSNLCDQLSFRGILSTRLPADHLNFATAGSSNQKQFRLARNFFISNRFKRMQQEYDKIIVLWGITSTARNELYDSNQKEYRNFSYTGESVADWPFTRSYLEYSYDQTVAVKELAFEIAYWNLFFKNASVTNLWFDTFNHHNYNYPATYTEEQYNSVAGQDWPAYRDYITGSVDEEIDSFLFDADLKTPYNLIFKDSNPRDLMSLLSIEYGLEKVDSGYHMSRWKNDSDRVSFLVKKQLLNPISKHPTKQGHIEIADLLELEIRKVL